MDRRPSPWGQGVTVNQYIYAQDTSYAGQQRAAERNMRILARARR